MKKTGVVLLIALGAMGWIYLAPRPYDSANLFNWSAPLQKAAWLGVGYLALLMGLFLGVIARALMKLHDAGVDQIAISSVIRASLRRPEFWLCMAGSPVLYGGIAAGAALGGLSYCYLALQTGFSSYIAIRALTESTGTRSGAQEAKATAPPVSTKM